MADQVPTIEELIVELRVQLGEITGERDLLTDMGDAIRNTLKHMEGLQRIAESIEGKPTSNQRVQRAVEVMLQAEARVKMLVFKMTTQSPGLAVPATTTVVDAPAAAPLPAPPPPAPSKTPKPPKTQRVKKKKLSPQMAGCASKFYPTVFGGDGEIPDAFEDALKIVYPDGLQNHTVRRLVAGKPAEFNLTMPAGQACVLHDLRDGHRKLSVLQKGEFPDSGAGPGLPSLKKIARQVEHRGLDTINATLDRWEKQLQPELAKAS